MNIKSYKCKKNKESFFWNLCYLTIFLDLFIVIFNPIPAEYVFFPNFFIISYFLALIISYLYTKLALNIDFNTKKAKILIKLSLISIFILTILFIAFFIFESGEVGQFIYTRNKVLVLVILFVIFSTVSSFKPLFKVVHSRISNFSKSNGFLFNLASFSARWLSLSSALLVNLSSYGYYVYFISIFLTFYFLNTIKNSSNHLN